MMTFKLFVGDCVEVMRAIPDNSIDAVIADPPYGLSDEPDMSVVLRHWLDDTDYDHASTGFMGAEWDRFVPGPKVWREALRILKPGGHLLAFAGSRTSDLMGLSIRLAGFEIRDLIAWIYGSGMPVQKKLKPALEPIIMGRKPITEKSVRSNVEQWRTGDLMIDRSRLPSGRRPANVVHDGVIEQPFFYCAKASKSDRDDGVSGEEKAKVTFQTGAGKSGKPSSMSAGRKTSYKNHHPTVKPTELMRYLCALVTPPCGVILDPFAGTGSTGRGAMLGGFRFIGCDLDSEYIRIARERITQTIKDRLS